MRIYKELIQFKMMFCKIYLKDNEPGNPIARTTTVQNCLRSDQYINDEG